MAKSKPAASGNRATRRAAARAKTYALAAKVTANLVRIDQTIERLSIERQELVDGEAKRLAIAETDPEFMYVVSDQRTHLVRLPRK